MKSIPYRNALDFRDQYIPKNHLDRVNMKVWNRVLLSNITNTLKFGDLKLNLIQNYF